MQEIAYELHDQASSQKETRLVKIKDELLRCMPFGELKSRNAMATVLSFAEDREKTYELMQMISHSTRAYLHNARGLKGFLVHGVPELILKAPEVVHEWQIVNVEELVQRVKACKTREESFEILRKGYPRMYIYVMTRIGMLDRVKEYREECKQLENAEVATQYSYYIHGWFLVWLEEQRSAGKIKQGTAKVVPEPGQMGSQTYDYEGEIDENGKACGVGIAKREGSASYKGTFYNNVIHGIIRFGVENDEYEGECRNGQSCSKWTWYGENYYNSRKRSIENEIWEGWNQKYGRFVTKTPEDAFYKDMKALNAFDQRSLATLIQEQGCSIQDMLSELSEREREEATMNCDCEDCRRQLAVRREEEE